MNKSKISYHKAFPEKVPQKQGMGDEDLLEHLIQLPFLAYARLTGLLLERLGYENVQLVGRMHQRGRNRDGGADLVATLPGGVASRKVVIQVKQFDGRNRIFQKHLDELRGVALRHKASEAVLITTGEVSPTIDIFALDDLPVPVRLIQKDTLLRLLKQHETALSQERQAGQTKRQVRTAKISTSFLFRVDVIPTNETP
jgi:restriction endonuclease Mrr